MLLPASSSSRIKTQQPESFLRTAANGRGLLDPFQLFRKECEKGDPVIPACESRFSKPLRQITLRSDT